MDLHLASLFERNADAAPRRPALISGNRMQSWGEFDGRASCLAGLLADRGVGPGTRVAIYAHNSNEYLEAQFAAHKLRAVPVGINFRYKADELVDLLTQMQAAVVVFHGCYSARIWEIRRRLPSVELYLQIDDATDLLLDGALDFEQAIRDGAAAPRVDRAGSDPWDFYTSGTTGKPKVVRHRHDRLLERLLAEADPSVGGMRDGADGERSLDSAPISLCMSPLMHAASMWFGAVLPLAAGGTVVTIARHTPDPDVTLAELERHQCTSLTLAGDRFAGPLADALDAAKANGRPYDLSALREIRSSGATWTAANKARLLGHHALRLVDVLVATEGAMARLVAERGQQLADGEFLLDEDVAVVNEGAAVGAGENGHVVAASMVGQGYVGDQAASARVFDLAGPTPRSVPGDLAEMLEDGRMRHRGREELAIVLAEHRVFPADVETVLRQHATVADCVVVGIPSDAGGERVAALVVAEEDQPLPDAAQLIEHAAAQLADYQVPELILPVPALRRSATGLADYGWARRTAATAAVR